MLKNPDGSLYCRYSVEEILDSRFAEDDYPYLSDVLGSDWAVSMNWQGGDSQQFHAAASKTAERIYGSW
jgi:hypothetical protein